MGEAAGAKCYFPVPVVWYSSCLVRILILLLAVTLILGQVGCSRAGGCAEGKTCLRYMAWGNPEQLDVERDLVNRFNVQNPDLSVKLFTVPGSSYGVKMTTMLVSGTAPDIMRVDHYNFPILQARGYFYDLTDIAAADKGFRAKDFEPLAIDEGTVNGRLYGLNALFGGNLVYYNKTLYAKVGITDPYELSKKGLWTWEQFRQNAMRLTNIVDGTPKTYGTDIPAFPIPAAIVWSFGGDLMNADQTQSRVGDPKTARAYQFLVDLIWKDHAAPTPSQSANSAFTFESGKLGMTINWMGMAPRYRSMIKDFEWDVCPMPNGPTVVKGNQLVVPKDCRHPEAAWRFMRFLTSEATEQMLCAQIRRAYPTRTAVSRSSAFLDTKQAPFNTRAFLDSVGRGRQLPITGRWAEWTTILNSEIDNLISGRERDAAVVLKRAEMKINRALGEPAGF